MIGRQRRDLPVKIELPDVTVIVGRQRGGLTGVHAAASADRNDAVMPALAIGFPC